MATNRRKHPPNPAIARRIRAALEFHEMSQADLARVLKCAPASISQVLSGKTKPLDQTLKRIAAALDEDPDFLMGYTNKGSKGYGEQFGVVMDKLGPEFVALLFEMTPDEIQKLAGKTALEQAKKRRKAPPATQNATVK